MSVLGWYETCVKSIAAIPVAKGSKHEKSTTGLHPDRVDDRGRDHRHSGRRCTAGLSGLHDPRQDVGTDSCHERVPYVDHRGVSVGCTAPAANNWGCEGGVASKYVAGI